MLSGTPEWGAGHRARTRMSSPVFQFHIQNSECQSDRIWTPIWSSQMLNLGCTVLRAGQGKAMDMSSCEDNG